MEEKDNVFKVCFHYKQFFGKVFERKGDEFPAFGNLIAVKLRE